MAILRIGRGYEYSFTSDILVSQPASTAPHEIYLKKPGDIARFKDFILAKNLLPEDSYILEPDEVKAKICTPDTEFFVELLTRQLILIPSESIFTLGLLSKIHALI